MIENNDKQPEPKKPEAPFSNINKLNPFIGGIDTTPVKNERKRNKFLSLSQNVPIDVLVAIALLGIGSILITVGVSIRYSVALGITVFGLILLALGVLIGLTS